VLGARDQFAALLPIRERVLGSCNPRPPGLLPGRCHPTCPERALKPSATKCNVENTQYGGC
jgi:hypothetical protein